MNDVLKDHFESFDKSLEEEKLKTSPNAMDIILNDNKYRI